MKEKRAVKAVIYHILVFAVGLVMIYPLIWMVMSSFKPTNTIFQTAGSLIPETFTFENYIQLFQNKSGSFPFVSWIPCLFQ